MTWKDKLELGIKEDAAIRKDNLSPNEVHGPEIPAGPGRSPVIPDARDDDAKTPPQPAGPSPATHEETATAPDSPSR